MQKRLRFRFFLTIGIILLAFYYLLPTVEWYLKSPEQRERLETRRSPMLDKILNLGLDLKGGTHLVYRVKIEEAPAGTDAEDAVDRALEIIRNRVDQFGVTEPLIHRQGEDWIVVQLPGIKDPVRAKELIGKTALLEFRLVDDKGRLKDALEGSIPEGYILMEGRGNSQYLVKEKPELTGAALTNADVKIGGQFNQPYVDLDFNDDGAKIFAVVTEVNIDKNLAIVLDGRVQSAPVIRTKIPDGKAIIEGNFTMDEAKNLAIILRAGALPAPVEVIEERTVGPTLGRDSIRQGTFAIALGGLAVVLFMILYYRKAGLLADSALFLNLIVLLGIMAYFRATLTLPGIAGIILMIGMAVDANVLIFERIREELKAGKTVRVAIDAGYSKAFSTILDSNVTTLIAAAFLFQFGTGPIKGFAVTLSLGILISMYTALVVTHLIFNLVLGSRKIETLSI